jgi:hypothetical protein
MKRFTFLLLLLCLAVPAAHARPEGPRRLVDYAYKVARKGSPQDFQALFTPEAQAALDLPKIKEKLAKEYQHDSTKTGSKPFDIDGQEYRDYEVNTLYVGGDGGVWPVRTFQVRCAREAQEDSDKVQEWCLIKDVER